MTPLPTEVNTDTENIDVTNVGSEPLAIPTHSIWLPQQTVAADLLTGDFLTEPSEDPALLIALRYLNENAEQFGLTTEDLSHLRVSDQYVSGHTGTTQIYLRQQLNGLDVVNADIGIHVTDDGQIIIASSSFVGGLPHDETVTSFEPTVSASEALQVFASDYGFQIDAGMQVLDTEFDLAQTTVVTAPGLSTSPVPAELVYTPVAGGGVELSWNVLIVTPDGDHVYNTSLSAEDGELLSISDWVDNAKYNVYELPAESPNDTGRTLIEDPWNDIASESGWQNFDGTETINSFGNNVIAVEDIDGEGPPNGFLVPTFLTSPWPGPLPNDPGAPYVVDFDFPHRINVDPLASVDASITNAFYVVNRVHDIFYLYGFDEAAGNFQWTNFTGDGLDQDPVWTSVLDGNSQDNASMLTPPDGFFSPAVLFPELQFGISTMGIGGVALADPDGFRDFAFDNGVAVHEFGHGVTNRLAGGPGNADALVAIQSGGMGEGWSDFFAMLMTQVESDQPGDAYAVGNYALGAEADNVGIRRLAYSFDMDINPLTYDDFNDDVLNDPIFTNPIPGAPNSEVHNAGEIWASVLWDLNWLLINGDGGANQGMGFDPDWDAGTGGNNLALQLVLDGLKLQPRNPSFLDGRDAILLADQVLTGGDNQGAIWTAFARRGMGYSAYDGGSGERFDVVEAFDMPPGLDFGGDIVFAGTVWNDLNASGVQNTGELGLPGWTVFLDFDSDGVHDPLEPIDVTDASGDYQFVVNQPGTYTVSLEVMPDYLLTAPAVASHTVLGQADTTYSGLDFGVRLPLATVTGTKWHDLDGDGLRDAGEPGLANVYIYADLDHSGTYHVAEPAAVTGADGSYQITGLAPGGYTIREVVPAGYQQTFPGPVASSSHVVTLGPNETVGGIDFGNQLAYDFGDLPDEYQTLLASNGARHGFSPVIRLGDLLDIETDGNPDPEALGDDDDRINDDEDGVLFTSGLDFGETATITVLASSNTAYLQGWMDFNADGDFDDPGEQIITDRKLTQGANNITFDVPEKVPGQSDSTYARFRYGVERGISYFGPALYGEVEDYAVRFPQPPDTGIVARNDIFSVNEDSTNNMLDVLDNDSAGPGGGTLVITDVELISGQGVATTDGGDYVIYTPPADYFGSAILSYTIEDGLGGGAQANVSLSIVDVNDPPDAVDDQYEIGVDTSLNILNVLSNDSIAPDVGETLTIVSVSDPDMGGEVFLNGSFLQYTPAPTFEGTETFTYTINDGRGGMDTATVTIDNVILPPIVDIRLRTKDQSGSVVDKVGVGETFVLDVYVEDLRGVPLSGVFSAFMDILYETDSIAVVPNSIVHNGPPPAGPYGLNAKGDTSTPGLVDEVGSITADTPLGPGEYLMFSVSFTATSEGEAAFLTDPADLPNNEVLVFGLSSEVPDSRINYGSTSITIEGIGAANDTYAGIDAVDEDSTDNQLDVLANDTPGQGGGPLSIVSVGTTSNGGTVDIVAGGTLLSFSPLGDFFGTETFSYTMTDGVNGQRSATVSVTVNNVNDPPMAFDDEFMVFENTSNNPLNVLENDNSNPDPVETLTITGVGTPDKGGSVSIDGNQLRYTPMAGFFGTETFTYTINDGAPGSDATATVTMTVEEVAGDQLTAVGDSFLGAMAVDEDSTNNPLDVLANDTANPGGTLMITGVGATNHGGSVNIVGGGTSLTYSPAGDFFGTETFTYTVADGIGVPKMATVTVEVAPTNDLPTAEDDMFDVGANSSANLLDVLTNDDILPDVGETLTITNVTTPAHGSASINGDQIEYTPTPGFSGPDTFSYTINDGTPGSDATATVTVDVGLPKLAAFRLETTTLNGQVISSVDVDEDFLVNVYVDDLRVIPIGDPAGIFSAYVDVMFDPAFVSFDMRETQEISLTGIPTGGSFTLTFDGETTLPITLDPVNGVNPSAIEFALELLPNLAPTDVEVSGEIFGPWTVRFGGVWADMDVPNMTADGSGLTGVNPDVEVSQATGVNPNNVIDVIGSITYGPDFIVRQRANLATPGKLDEAGATRSTTTSTSPVGLFERLLFTAQFSGDSAGQFDFSNAFATDIGDEVNLFGLSNPLTEQEIDFGGDVPFEVLAGSPAAFLNAYMPADVNGDGYVTPNDAILVINELNNNGPDEAPWSPGTATTTFFVDTNGDNNLTPVDALYVINELNSQDAFLASLAAASSGGASGAASASYASPTIDPSSNAASAPGGSSAAGQADPSENAAPLAVETPFASGTHRAGEESRFGFQLDDASRYEGTFGAHPHRLARLSATRAGYRSDESRFLGDGATGTDSGSHIVLIEDSTREMAKFVASRRLGRDSHSETLLEANKLDDVLDAIVDDISAVWRRS